MYQLQDFDTYQESSIRVFVAEVATMLAGPIDCCDHLNPQVYREDELAQSVQRSKS